MALLNELVQFGHNFDLKIRRIIIIIIISGV